MSAEALSSSNPWSALPAVGPFVLPADEPYLAAFHRHETAAHHFRLDLPPDPWLGRWDAPVVVLLQNPSFDVSDEETFARPDVREWSRRNVSSEAGALPHYWLKEEFASTYSGTWWRRTLGRLVQQFGVDAVAASVLAVEMYGYRTRTFRALPATLPSQRFALTLVESAMAREAVVVLPRAAPLWEVALPALHRYPRLVRGRSRNALLSAGNLADEGYAAICTAVGSWSRQVGIQIPT